MRDHTIDDVIAQLDDIIERCHRQASRLGFFPAMYRKTTAEVKRAIEAGRFEDPVRMERLDVVFARRYLEAYRRFERDDIPAVAWDYAFRMARSSEPSVVQHLLLGMNAHINLDLGISAADVAPGESLHDLKRDFDVINAILGEMVDGVQDDLTSVFPLLGALDLIGLRFDEVAVHMAIKRARATAWDKALLLSRCPSEAARAANIARFDGETLGLAHRICSPEHATRGLAVDVSDGPTIRRVIEALAD